MKKFFTIVPLQPNGMQAFRYPCEGNKKLDLDEKISFPILAAIAGYVQPDEDYQLIVVKTPGETIAANYETLLAQTKDICAKHALKEPSVIEVNVPDDESVSTELASFQRMIDIVSDDDELFACMSYGTKPLSTVMMMAVQYANRIKKNTFLSCVVYGKINRPTRDPQTWTAELFDETALIRMDELVSKLAGSGVSNPEAVIRNLLSL